MPGRASGYPQPPGWKRTHARILRRDPRCRIAGAECTGASETVDHIKPVAEGGSHDEANLQGVCHRCHAAKTEAERLRALRKRSRHRPPRRNPNILD